MDMATKCELSPSVIFKILKVEDVSIFITSSGLKWLIYIYIYCCLPSGYLTVRHGKSPFIIGKPSISMGHLYPGYVSHNQRVILVWCQRISLQAPETRSPASACGSTDFEATGSTIIQLQTWYCNGDSHLACCISCWQGGVTVQSRSPPL